jgi:glucosamine--fructose-6-phosphate aminotransferase (isomerizing)
MSQYADFITQIDSLPELVKTEARQIDDRMRLLIKTPEIYGIRQIILLGSGDSYFAAQAVAPAIRAWTGLPVSAMLAMEAARYVDAGVPPLAGRNRGLLVVSISSSGEAARVVEATQRLRKLGALTLAVTANAESRLGLSAERILGIAIPSSTNAPGTRSYVASMLAGYSIGLRLAEVLMTMTMDEANALRAEIIGLGDKLDEASRISAEPVMRLSETWQQFRTADVLGSGPALASAGYGAAKLVEAAGVHATAQDAEEFHHLNYFVTAPEQVPVVAFAAGAARAASRTRELVSTLEGLGRPSLIVTDTAELPAYGMQIRLPEVREWFAPLLHAVPSAHLAAAWADRLGVTHYRGHTGPWRHAQGAGLVRNSTLEV